MVEYYYPMPTATDFLGLFKYANTVTGNIFGLWMVFAFYFIVFISLKNYPTEKAFASANFTTAVFSYFLSVVGLIPLYVVLIPTVLSVVSLFILWKGKGAEGE